MNCSACNAELKSGADKCLECGQPVGAASTASSPKSPADWANLTVRIVKLEDAAIAQAANDPAATTAASIVIAAGIVAPVLGSFGALLFVAPIILIGTVAVLFGIHFCATMLGGKARFEQLLRVQGLAMMLTWVNAVPVIGFLFGGIASLWYMVVTANNVRALYKLSWLHAVIALVLPGAILTAAGFAMAFVLGASLFALVR